MKLIIKQSLILVFSAVFATPSTMAASISDAQIIKWLINPDSTNSTLDKISIEETHTIKLANGEPALISGVHFDDSGRNFWGGYILTRPYLKKSMFLSKFGGQTNEISILSKRYGATLIQLESAGSGQGDIDSTESIVSFKGWVPQVVYSTSNFSHGFGRYTADEYPQKQCEERETKFKFIERITAPQVIETVNYYKGKCGDDIALKDYKTKTKTLTIKLP